MRKAFKGRLILMVFILPGFVFTIHSCSQKEEPISPVAAPVIEFVSISKEKHHEYDSAIRIKIIYSDLDMDLGVRVGDEFNFNYLLTPYERIGNTYKEVFIPDSIPPFHSVIPELENIYTSFPPFEIITTEQTKVEINYIRGLTPEFKDLLQNNIIKFKISVVDRAGNNSNEVETPEIIYNKL